MPRYAGLVIAVALFAWGCYGSSAGIDAATDAPDAADSQPDTAIDPGTDTAVDPGTDTVSPTYVLHEWGVLVYGPGGASIHGPSPEYAGPIADKPVIYIYTEEPLTMDVTVGFASGQAEETWPVTALGPVVSWPGIQVTPGACDATPFPSIWEDPWVDESCEACTLGTCVVEEAACLATLDQVAKLLFYAGSLPGYARPLLASAVADEASGTVTFSVSSSSALVIEDVWLLYRVTTDTCMDPSYCPVATADLAVGFAGSIAPGSGFSTTVPITHLVAELDASGYPIPGTLGTDPEWEAVPEEVRAALLEHGLTAPEADAFMAAWDQGFFGILGSDSYFSEPMYHHGAYVLYFMPAADYDEQLPLQASPSPSEIVRVGMVYQQI